MTSEFRELAVAPMDARELSPHVEELRSRCCVSDTKYHLRIGKHQQTQPSITRITSTARFSATHRSHWVARTSDTEHGLWRVVDAVSLAGINCAALRREWERRPA